MGLHPWGVQAVYQSPRSPKIKETLFSHDFTSLFFQPAELAFNVLDTPSYDVVGERMEPMGRMTHHREDEDVAVESRNAVFASASLPFVDVGRSNKPSRSALHQVRSSCCTPQKLGNKCRKMTFQVSNLM